MANEKQAKTEKKKEKANDISAIPLPNTTTSMMANINEKAIVKRGSDGILCELSEETLCDIG